MAQTLELSRAELWFCAFGTPAKGQSRQITLRTGNGERHIRVRLVPSILPPIQNDKRAFELFLQEETERTSEVLRRDGTLYWSDEERANDDVWKRNIAKTLVGRTSRVYLPPNRSFFCITLHNTGEGAIVGRTEDALHLDSTPFVWGSGTVFEQFAFWPQTEFKSYFDEQFHDVSSSLRRAYEWHGWNEDERTSHVLRCEQGSWDELRALAECVLVLTFEDEDDFWDDSGWDVLSQSHQFLPHGNLLGAWSQVFRRVFRPFATSENALPFERSHFHNLEAGFLPLALQCEPSAHEKLEAHLRLREWVMEHAPDEAERLLDFSRWA